MPIPQIVYNDLLQMAEFKAPSLEANSMQQGTYTPKGI